MSGDLLDVEGRENDDALLAESTGRVLQVEADAPEPVTLPSAEQFVDEEAETGTDTADHDPETGELIETATDENPTAAEGRADADHGDQHDGTEAEPKRAGKKSAPKESAEDAGPSTEQAIADELGRTEEHT